MGIVLTALLLSAGADLRAQVSNPAGTIQGTKQQVNQAAKGQPQTTTASKQGTSAQPAKTQTTSPKQPAKISQTAKPPAKSPSKTAPGKAAAKSQAKAPAKTSAKAPAKAETTKTAKPAAASEKVAKRDPFSPLLNKQRSGGVPAEALPPGKAGLVVGTLRIDGIVRGPNGMIAIVSNPQQSVYFLREGDQLYDGRVLHIDLQQVAFHESGKDAFGKPVDREVTKRLYPVAGEQP